MLGTIVLCLAAAAWQPPRSAEFEAAYAKGCEEAARELEQGRPVLYTYGLVRNTLDRETGLPLVAISGCLVDDAILGRAAGHNERLKEQIAAHGALAGSYKAWDKELFDLKGFFAAADAAKRSGTLELDGPIVKSPDGKSSLGLRRIPADPNSAAATASDLLASSEKGETTISLAPHLSSAGKVEVAWGPEGSNLAMVRWSDLSANSAADRVIAAVDVKIGRWIRQETGR